MKNILWPGLLAGVVIFISDLVIGKVAGMIRPTITGEYMAGLFRPWSDPRMMLYFLYPFIVGIIMAYVWSRVKGLFTGATAMQNGRNFGLFAWLAVCLPGMFVTYTSFVVSLSIVLSWTVSGLVGLVLAGIVLAKLTSTASGV